MDWGAANGFNNIGIPVRNTASNKWYLITQDMIKQLDVVGKGNNNNNLNFASQTQYIMD